MTGCWSLKMVAHWSQTGRPLAAIQVTSQDKLLVIVKWSQTSHWLVTNWLQSFFYKMIRRLVTNDRSLSTHGSLTKQWQPLITGIISTFLYVNEHNWLPVVAGGCYVFLHQIDHWHVPSQVWLGHQVQF